MHEADEAGVWMIGTRVVGEDLEITLTGRDCWMINMRCSWATRVPLAEITAIGSAPPIRLGARNRYGILEDGRRPRRAGHIKCARPGAPVLKLEVSDGPYREITLSVPDPAQAEQEIRSAAHQRLDTIPIPKYIQRAEDKTAARRARIGRRPTKPG
jgi:hypothetical protein